MQIVVLQPRSPFAIILQLLPLTIALALFTAPEGKAQVEPMIADSLVAAKEIGAAKPGWDFELASGFVAWRKDSRYGSGSPLAEAALSYTASSGVSGGVLLSFSGTEIMGIGTLARVGYNFNYVRAKTPFAVIAFGGPKAKLNDGFPVSDYSGWQYGAEAQLRPRIGARKHAQAFVGIGFQTIKERYNAGGWTEVSRKLTHSGLRIRIGVAF